LPDALVSPDDAALAEEVELDLDARKRVLLLHAQLDGRDHYALLGVARDADKKVIKKAYYDLAGIYHPDRYFRKKLGSFKARMEVIFSRITFAHDILSDAQKRAEYDAYLAEQGRSRSIEELMEDALAEIRRAEEIIAKEAQDDPAPSPVTPVSTPRVSTIPTTPVSTPRVSTVPTTPVSTPRVSSVPPTPVTPALTDAARREALARKLLGGRTTPRPSGPPPAPSQQPPPIPSAAGAMGTLRRRYEERVTAAKATVTKRYIDAAEAAKAAGDLVAAATSLRVAASLAPGDAALADRAREAQKKADGVLAETYSRQAVYEEKNDQWAEAARSWARVCRAHPDDAKAHDRAANAMVKAEGNTHEAGRLAQRACALEPANPRFRITLATIYQAAGMALNARRELETAAQLAPQDDTIQAMLKRVGHTT
jgi:hypothetical protein